jgi:hypothetical protein
MTQKDVAEDAKRLIFRARLVEEAQWKARARAEGVTFSEWVRRSLNRCLGMDPVSAGFPVQRAVRVPLHERRLSGEPLAVVLPPGIKVERCTADVAYGTVCKICGKMHP